jgi:hypothetical protein
MEKPDKNSRRCFLMLYQYSNTPLLQFFATPILQLSRSDDEDHVPRKEFFIGRKLVHVPPNDYY